MNPDVVIVRLGELTLKGRNRHRFEKRIQLQLKTLLQPYPQVRMKTEFGRIYLQLNGAPYKAIAACLDKIFGLFSYSPAFEADMALDSIRHIAVELMKSLQPIPMTFKVSAKRANKDFAYDSQQLGYLVGGHVLHAIEGLKVDVNHPEVELRIDIRQKDVYIFAMVISGTGGYPLGSNGKAMLMLSGGIDSPVAGWLAMRQGLEIEVVHFHSFPFTSEKAKQKVIDLTRSLSAYTDRIRLHFVPFTEIQMKLNEHGLANLIITLMRRTMFRITEQLAGQCGATAIITGESLGQVASQTLPSLHTIGQVVGIPLLRPLIMMDKAEIIRLAERIETYRISILPYEDCCTLFMPKSPSTNPNARVVQRVEDSLVWLEPAIEKAITETEILDIQWNMQHPLDAFF